MKIISILKERSHPNHIVCKTDPPVTEDILAWAKPHSGDLFEIFNVSIEGENLVLSAAPRMQEKELIEHVFSQAEKFIDAEQEEAKKTHNDFLDYVSKKSGLPLE